MPDHSPSAADADAAAQHDDSSTRPPRTPTTPSSPFSGSFFTRPSPSRPSPGASSLSRSFNIHALGFNTSPLGPLGRRISFYEGDSGDDDDEEERAVEGSLGHLEEGFSNDSSQGGWRTSEDGDDDGDGSSSNNWNSLDDPIALEDRKDVLIDRLNDMVRHVTSYAPSSPSLSNRSASTWNSPGKSTSAAEASEDNPAEGGTVLTALHAHIDKMEAVLAAAQAAEAAALAASPRAQRHHRHLSHPNHFLWQRPEPRLASERRAAHARRITLDAAPILFRNQSAPLPESGLLTPKISERIKPVAISSAVAEDCNTLAGDLSAVLTNLLKRRQESELIQETLLQKLAEANRRTAELEAQVRALMEEKSNISNDVDDTGGDSSSGTETATEKGGDSMADKSLDEVSERLADLDDFSSELSFLRLQLRGIEARCQSYIPADADPELAESIENWKADWSALRAKVNEERRSTTASMTASMSLHNRNNSILSDINSTF
ncbi:hypothetical protein SEUCBS139899_001583 [Sporothrix eucalyptigena]